MPALRQPLFAGGDEHPLGPLGGLVIGGDWPEVEPGDNQRLRDHPAKAVAGMLPGRRRGGARMIGAVVSVPKGSLNDRGLLGRAY